MLVTRTWHWFRCRMKKLRASERDRAVITLVLPLSPPSGWSGSPGFCTNFASYQKFSEFPPTVTVKWVVVAGWWGRHQHVPVGQHEVHLLVAPSRPSPDDTNNRRELLGRKDVWHMTTVHPNDHVSLNIARPTTALGNEDLQLVSVDWLINWYYRCNMIQF